ncbi:MAG: signal peptidase I [Clostridia bacterium]|nr:signal peptidase I [Clostridia bacterium]
MNKTVKKVWNWITAAIVIVVVIVALLLVGARIAGFHVYAVLSGSMEPAYHVGSLIYVKEVDAHELKSGDVITFMVSDDTVATHRIVEVVPDEEDPTVVRFRTKGDANEAIDGSLVHYKNVIGTPVFSIPKLGYVSTYIQNPPGTYVAIAAAAVLLLLVFLPDLFGGDSDKKKEKEDAKDSEKSEDSKETEDSKVSDESKPSDNPDEGNAAE